MTTPPRKRMMSDPAIAKIVREHAKGLHVHIRLDCPVCRRFRKRRS